MNATEQMVVAVHGFCPNFESARERERESKSNILP